MLSYTTRRNLFGKLSNNESADNLTVGDTLMNEFDREIVTDDRYSFRDTYDEIDTVASQQAYSLEADTGSVFNVTVLVSTTLYTPKEVTSRKQWDRINQSTTTTADTPQYYYIDKQDGNVELYPTPSSSSNTITIHYQKNYKDLSLADYTTGTITSIANDASAVVGDSTVWTDKMVGRFIRLTDSDTDNTGDGFWYEISAVASNTALTLKKRYKGESVAAGTAAYAIAQVSLLPEAHQKLPVFAALEVYYSSIQPEENRATLYKRLKSEGEHRLRKDQLSKSTSPVVSELCNDDVKNPNLYVEA